MSPCVFLACFIGICFCQNIESPVINWIQPSSPLMPGGQNQLLPGYDRSTNRIWLIGGGQAYNAGSTDIWYYDINQNNFTDYGSLQDPLTNPHPLDGQSSTQIENSIFFPFQPASPPFILKEFDMTSGAVTPTNRAMLTNVASPCMVNDGRYIFLMGGYDTIQYEYNTFQIYDTVNNNWVYGAPALISRRRAASCAISPQNYIYLFGGYYSHNFDRYYERSIDKIYIGDMENIQTATWNRTQMSMTYNLQWSRAVLLYDLIYILGGNPGSLDVGKIEVVDPSIDEIEVMVPALNTIDRYQPGVIVVNDVIYAFGGFTANRTLDTFEMSEVLITTTTTHANDAVNSKGISIFVSFTYENVNNLTSLQIENILTNITTAIITDKTGNECIVSDNYDVYIKEMNDNLVNINATIQICDEETTPRLLAIFENNLKNDIVDKTKNNGNLIVDESSIILQLDIIYLDDIGTTNILFGTTINDENKIQKQEYFWIIIGVIIGVISFCIAVFLIVVVLKIGKLKIDAENEKISNTKLQIISSSSSYCAHKIDIEMNAVDKESGDEAGSSNVEGAHNNTIDGIENDEIIVEDETRGNDNVIHGDNDIIIEEPDQRGIDTIGYHKENHT